ncbi:hypothetical protein [Helicobacter winghamensis]|uniref:hypothetical protein n=1 Tax=Helicobacter winghamensis TaxID=157268 RepID=UPI00351BB3B9
MRSFDIITNATIDFKEELLQAIKKAKKFRKVSISDYSTAPNLKIPLKQESIFKTLKAYKIPYSFLSGGIWYKVEKIYKRNRTKEEIVANFHACGMPCVSLMSGDTREQVRTNESKSSVGGGGYFCVSCCKLFV